MDKPRTRTAVRRFCYVSDGHSYLLGSSALKEERASERKRGSEIKVDGRRGRRQSVRSFVRRDAREDREERVSLYATVGRGLPLPWDTHGKLRGRGGQISSLGHGSNSRNRSPVHARWNWKDTEPLKPSNFDRHRFILEKREYVT